MVKNGKAVKISSETKNEVVYQKETNYFQVVDVPRTIDSILKQNPEFIKPKHRYQFILKELEDTKLPDLSISRPSSRLKWSIEVPNDSTQRFTFGSMRC